MPEFRYKKLLSPLDKGSGHYTPNRQQSDGYTNTQQPVYIEELKKVNDELRQARRAALNLMEDAIASKEALQKSEKKYRTLFESMDEGYVLCKVIFDKDEKPVDIRCLEANQAAVRMAGIELVGKTIREMNGDLEEYWFDTWGRVAKTGIGERHEYFAGPLGLWFSFYVFKVGTSEGTKVAAVYEDITQRKNQEQRQEFLLKFNDALRWRSAAVEIQEIVSNFTINHFKSDRCYYCVTEGDQFIIQRDTAKEGFTCIAGVYSMSDIPIFKAVVDTGKPFIVNNVNTTDLVEESLRQLCIQLQIISFIGVPVIKDDMPDGILCIVQSTPRIWTQFEIHLAAEIAERTWAAVERANAEESLRINEQRTRIQKEAFQAAINGETLENSLNILTRIVKEEIGKEIRTGFYMAYPDGMHLHGISGAGDMTESYMKQVDGLAIGEDSFGCGLAIATGQPVLTRNVFEEPLWKSHIHFAQEHNFRACGSFPIKTGDNKPVGIFAMYFIEAHEFTQQEVAAANAVAQAAAIIISRDKEVQQRSLAEGALRHSEERFRTLTNAVPQIIWTNDGDGKANFFNERWYKYSGLNYEESVGLGWEAIVHPDDAPASQELWQKALAAGITFDTEYRLRRHDDVYRWHIGRNIPLKNKEGKITAWFGSATEIEELKQTEKALRESEAKMKITFESATDFAIITINKDCHIESWNSGAEKIFGYREEEVKGQSCNFIFTPEDIADDIPQKEIKRAKESGHAADDRWHIRRNGERFFVSGVTSPIYDNEGLSGYVKVARDMTKQREAEENLRIWEERYRIALISAKMGAWDWNIPQNELIWNEQQYVLLGLQPDNKEKSLEDFLRYIQDGDKEQVIHGLQTAIENTGVFQMEFRIKRADNNEVRWINKFGLVVTKKDNRAARMIGVMYDITERKKLEQQKEDFIGIASHELKTPVTSIKAYTEILQEMCNEGDYAAGGPLVQKLNRQVDRLIELVHALLDITKIAEGELPLHIEEFDFKQLVEECVENLQRTKNSCRIIIQTKKEILIHADRERINQVLTNLISNAVKYSPNGGDVTITWKQTAGGTEVSVQDEGIGISKEMQTKVFGRFFRVNDGKANTFPGMGLGLYITSNIVQRHGGKIWMESEPGKGSVFYFILPDNKHTP